MGKNIAPRFAHRYYDAVTVGIDFTARDLQARLRAEGSPWEISKGFDGSAVVGDFIPVDEVAGNLQDLHFSLRIDGKEVQRGHTADMIFPVDEMIAYISRFYTLRMGDLLLPGRPKGLAPLPSEIVCKDIWANANCSIFMFGDSSRSGNDRGMKV